jgi:hypothetical protein
LCIVTQIKDINPHKKCDIEIVTKKRQEYLLLTDDSPMTFTVEGPTYLRVYTRTLWPAGEKGHKLYKIILQENELDEKILTFESEQSTTSKDIKGRPLSKWRSFYIEVPEGDNTYKLTHWASPKDTLFLRFSYESPKTWKDLAPTDYSTIIETIEEEKIVKYYEVQKNKTVKLRLQGPTRVKVVSRLNYTVSMMGTQNYALLVNDNSHTEQKDIRGYKSDIIEYHNRKDIVPSNAHTFYVNVNSGVHTLEFSLSGTIASSAALRFQIEK